MKGEIIRGFVKLLGSNFFKILKELAFQVLVLRLFHFRIVSGKNDLLKTINLHRGKELLQFEEVYHLA